MPSLRRSSSVLVLALCCAALVGTSSARAAAPETAVPGLRGDILKQLHDAQSKLAQLAEATPAAKYTWRPAEGVRSTGEVFMHVASSNYGIASIWGAKVPADADARNLEKMGGDRDKAMAAMKASFAFLDQQIAALSDADLDREVSMFGHKSTVRATLLLLATHAHEHLGQSIAYARMNGIAPPWSKKGD